MSDDMRMMEENFTVYDHTKQPRRTHFGGKKEGDHGSQTQTSIEVSSSKVPLDDQPFADTTSKIYGDSVGASKSRSQVGMDEVHAQSPSIKCVEVC